MKVLVGSSVLKLPRVRCAWNGEHREDKPSTIIGAPARGNDFDRYEQTRQASWMRDRARENRAALRFDPRLAFNA